MKIFFLLNKWFRIFVILLFLDSILISFRVFAALGFLLLQFGCQIFRPDRCSFDHLVLIFARLFEHFHVDLVQCQLLLSLHVFFCAWQQVIQIGELFLCEKVVHSEANENKCQNLKTKYKAINLNKFLISHSIIFCFNNLNYHYWKRDAHDFIQF